jgi:hypothetical protein
MFQEEDRSPQSGSNQDRKIPNNPLGKPLDIKHKMCYNEYEKRKENLTNQKGQTL